ncbi:hypothetical protein D3C72_643590 [compost metagenome]|jgi:hypothetical protein
MSGYLVDISLNCPDCSTYIEDEVEVSPPNLMAENSRDSTTTYELEISCPTCGADHPATSATSFGGVDIVLDDHPNVRVSTGMASYAWEGNEWDSDEWLTDLLKDDPAFNFRSAHGELVQFLSNHGETSGTSFINRMILTQLITMLETYLGDNLLQNVATHPDLLKPLFSSDRVLNAERFSLSEIAKNPNIPRDTALAYLRKNLWHDLRRADYFYNTILGIRILSEPDTNALLLKAVAYRHDCVHRNGKTHDDEKLDSITAQYVGTVAREIHALVGRLERETLGVILAPLEKPEDEQD